MKTTTLFIMGILGRSWWFWIVVALVIYYVSQKQKKKPIKERMPNDLLHMKRQTERFQESLIPWEKAEIELLSLNKQDEKVQGKGDREISGAFVSIYHEPLFSYGYKIYAGEQRHGALYARTKGNEFFFKEFPKEVDVQVNGKILGKIMDGKLFGTDGRMLANYLDNRLEGHTSIIINNKDVGHILKRSAYSNDVNPRALDLVDDILDIDEIRIFLAMTIWKVVEDNVE